MRRATVYLLIFFTLCSIVQAAAADSISPPPPPASVNKWLPVSSEFGEGLGEMLERSVPVFKQELSDGLKTGLAVLSCALLISVFQATESNQTTSELAGCACISGLLVQNSSAMITLAATTIIQITEYEKLFFPVISAAAAAQGNISSSSALYIGTSVFLVFLSRIIQKVMLPSAYLYVAIIIAHCAMGDSLLKRVKEQFNKIMIWFLKTFLTVFFSYMSITQALSGTADKAAVKTTKAAISAAVPVIGGSLAEASEAILISAGIMKNAVGIYGVFVIFAFMLTPFIKIGTQYLILKGTASVSTIFGTKRLSDLINDFSTALGLLLAMIGALSVMAIIGVVCYIKLV